MISEIAGAFFAPAGHSGGSGELLAFSTRGGAACVLDAASGEMLRSLPTDIRCVEGKAHTRERNRKEETCGHGRAAAQPADTHQAQEHGKRKKKTEIEETAKNRKCEFQPREQCLKFFKI